jgi:hypothetical protein
MIALGFAAEVAKRQERTNGVVRRILVPYAFILREILMKRMLTDGGRCRRRARQFLHLGLGQYPVGFFPPETQKYVVYSLADFVNKAVYSVMLSVSCAP